MSQTKLIESLKPLRESGGARATLGLSDEAILQFAATHADLVAAIEDGVEPYRAFAAEMPEVAKLGEAEQVRAVHAGFVNFYQEDALNPYLAIAARGPWIVTSKGAVIYDTGGYGMLGFGHTPDSVLAAMSKPQVMANIMTPSPSHLRFSQALMKEIGHTRGGSPYAKFLCLNSGSEAV